MRYVASLIVAVSLVVGLVCAATAYLVPLGLDDAQLVGLTSNETISLPMVHDESVIQADAGDRVDGGTSPAAPPPLLVKGQTLDASTIAALRAAGAKRVRVEEFSFSRWRERWLFIVAAIALLGGGLLARSAARAALAESETTAPGTVATPAPEALLATIAATVDDLIARWPSLRGNPAKCDATCATLDPIIEGTIPTFAAARPRLVARLGLGGYASLMDRFAAAERQIHRAWSAAADGVPEESYDCLRRARHLLGEAQTRLSALSA